MIKSEQTIFYKNLGSLVTRQREAVGLTIAQLARESGEQNKTIRCIEQGRPCSMHHIEWMSAILGVDLNSVDCNEKESSDVSQFI